LQAGAGSRYEPALVHQFVTLVRRLQDSVDDLGDYLAEPASRSAFMQVRSDLAERLAQPGP
jgi:hypothetical protein